MKAYSIRTNGEIFEPEVKEERSNKHRKEKEQECNCNRPYEIELTEQEWLQTASTEQLVSFLLWYPNNVHGYPKPKMSIAEEENAIREWLKQPHQSVTNCNE